MRAHDPDQAEIFRERLAVAIEAFKRRELSDNVFAATLKQFGFFGNRLRDEFNYWDTIRHEEETRCTNMRTR